MSRTKIIASRVVLLTLSVFFVLLVLFTPFFLSYAHNNSITVIPISRSSIDLDGIITPQEWSDAYQQNLTSAGLPRQYTLLYLKYDLSEEALQGAFKIPDETPSAIKGKLDQISFHFDTLHDAEESIDSDDHFIIITRDRSVEYYIGDPTRSDRVKSVKNSTLNAHAMDLQAPFSRIDFTIINSSNSEWTAEFEIHLESEFEDSYGFAMQQVDFHTPLDTIDDNNNASSNSSLDSNHANFPIINRTLAYNPSTWGDLRVANFHQILQNVKSLCPSGNNLPFSVESNILCITGLNRNQIDENDPAQIIVSGRFADFINNSGISNEQLHINIVDPINMLQSVWEGGGGGQSDYVTRFDGRFEYQLRDVTLPSGNYFVKVEPMSAKYKGLNATTPIVVNERALTLDDAVGYLQLFVGVIGGIIGVVVGFPPVHKYRLQRKQKSILYERINKLNEDYYDLAHDNTDLLNKLKKERTIIVNLLADGKINEEQFRMLDDKISEYENRSGDRE